MFSLTELPLVPLQEREKQIVSIGRRAWPPPISQIISTVNQIYHLCRISAFHLLLLPLLPEKSIKPLILVLDLGRKVDLRREAGWNAWSPVGFWIFVVSVLVPMTQSLLLVSLSVKGYFNRRDYVNERKGWSNILNSERMSVKLYSTENTVQLKDVSCFQKENTVRCPHSPCGWGAADGRHQAVEVTLVWCGAVAEVPLAGLEVACVQACLPSRWAPPGLWEWRALSWEGPRRKIWPVSVVHLITCMVSPGTQEMSTWPVRSCALVHEFGSLPSGRNLVTSEWNANSVPSSWGCELARQSNCSFLLWKLSVSVLPFLKAVALEPVSC